MERQIGERFLDNGVELEVVEFESKYIICDGCHYHTYLGDCNNYFRNSGICYSTKRQDNNNVIFKKVEK